jgi:hypothetical protein
MSSVSVVWRLDWFLRLVDFSMSSLVILVSSHLYVVLYSTHMHAFSRPLLSSTAGKAIGFETDSLGPGISAPPYLLISGSTPDRTP